MRYQQLLLILFTTLLAACSSVTSFQDADPLGTDGTAMDGDVRDGAVD